MRKVLILHGWHASPPPHWQDWLARELVSRGVIVAFPQLSNPMNPSRNLWMREAAEVLKALHPDTVVCHSLGNVLWWHLCLEQTALHVEKLLMVAPPRDLSDYEAVAEFFPVALPQKLYAAKSVLVTSEDDPYLSKAEALHFARALDVEHVSFHNMGHINAQSGYGPWPWILDQVMA